MGNVRGCLGLTAVLMCVAGCATPAPQAGVRVDLVQRSSGFNGANIWRNTLYFQGDKSRSDSTVTYTSAWMRHLLKREGRPNPDRQVIIDRVDDNQEFGLNPIAKTYNESPLFSPSYVHTLSPAPPESTHALSPADSWVHITEMKSELEPTSQSRVINSFPARLYRLVFQEEAEDSKTGRILRSRLIKELWNSTDPRVLAAYRIYLGYNRALAKLYHTSLSVSLIQQIPMISMPFNSGEINKPGEPDPLSKLPGFPVEVTTKWTIECLSHCARGVADHDPQRQKPAAANAADADVSGIRGTHRQPGSAVIAATITGPTQMEILAIHIGRLPASLFKVPAGYKKN